MLWVPNCPPMLLSRSRASLARNVRCAGSQAPRRTVVMYAIVVSPTTPLYIRTYRRAGAQRTRSPRASCPASPRRNVRRWSPGRLGLIVRFLRCPCPCACLQTCLYMRRVDTHIYARAYTHVFAHACAHVECSSTHKSTRTSIHPQGRALSSAA